MHLPLPPLSLLSLSPLPALGEQKRQANPFVSPNPPAVNPSGQPADPLTTDVIIGISIACGAAVILILGFTIREIVRRRRIKQRKRMRERGIPVPPRKPRKPTWWARVWKKKQPPRPIQIPRAGDESALKQPLTAHTRNKSSLDSNSTTGTAGQDTRKGSLDSAYAFPRVSPETQPWKGHFQPVTFPPPTPQGQADKKANNKLRKPRRSPTSPNLHTGEKADHVQPTLPSIVPDPVPLPFPPSLPFVTTPFNPNLEKPSFPPSAFQPAAAHLPDTPLALAMAGVKPRLPTPQFDPVAYRAHMHRFSEVLSDHQAQEELAYQQQQQQEPWDQLREPGQRLSFVFDELTRRVVQSSFTPSLPDELEVREGEEVAVLECFDDGWSVVQLLPASQPRAGVVEEEMWQGVIPTQCWAGVKGQEVVKPMRYSSLRHGVDQGVFEIGTAL